MGGGRSCTSWQHAIFTTWDFISRYQIQLLIGASPTDSLDEGDSNVDTPLMIAAYCYNTRVAQWLLANGAKMGEQNNKKQTAEDVAEASGSEAVLILFRKLESVKEDADKEEFFNGGREYWVRKFTYNNRGNLYVKRDPDNFCSVVASTKKQAEYEPGVARFVRLEPKSKWGHSCTLRAAEYEAAKEVVSPERGYGIPLHDFLKECRD